MDRLKKARSQIDKIDRQMQALFEERMAVAADIATAKKAAGLPILDADRQREVLARNTAHLKDKGLAEYYTRFMTQLMSLSRQHQSRILGRATVAVPGKPKDAPCQAAALLFPGAEMMPAASDDDVFRAVDSGAAAYGVVAFGTSGKGQAAGVLELCQRYRCYIGQMLDAPIENGNTARYLVLWHEKPDKGERMALFITIENEVGQLAHLVELVAAEGLHIESIKTQPMKKKAPEVTYYMELDLPAEEEKNRRLLRRLQKVCIQLRVLGRYTVQVLDAPLGTQPPAQP